MDGTGIFGVVNGIFDNPDYLIHYILDKLHLTNKTHPKLLELYETKPYVKKYIDCTFEFKIDNIEGMDGMCFIKATRKTTGSRSCVPKYIAEYIPFIEEELGIIIEHRGYGYTMSYVSKVGERTKSVRKI